MEKLKEPPMIWGAANSAAILAVVYIFNNQMEEMRAEILKVTQAVSSVVRKLGDFEKVDQSKTEALQVLNEQLKNMNDRMGELASVENIEMVVNEVTNIVDVLNNNDIPIELLEEQKSIPSYRKDVPSRLNQMGAYQKPSYHALRGVETIPPASRIQGKRENSYLDYKPEKIQRGQKLQEKGTNLPNNNRRDYRMNEHNLPSRMDNNASDGRYSTSSPQFENRLNENSYDEDNEIIETVRKNQPQLQH